MEYIRPKHEMSEEDIKRLFITPALEAKWSKTKITMETRVTDGMINLQGNQPVRKSPLKADYILYLSNNNPIAIVEAKGNQHSVRYGLQQAMNYAQMLDLPFAFSTNGEGFAEHDFLTGMERELSMESFPTENELMQRFRTESNEGQGLEESQNKILAQPYYSGTETYPPRYYQRIAINRTLDAIARGQDRILLVMATGTGKTYVAFQIVYRLLKSGIKRKVLYLADRNILVDQSIQQDFFPLEKTIHKINVSKDTPETITSYEVYFALYQQLVGDDGKKHYEDLFKSNFFDLIIVDECHRGSANEDSRWRDILEYFASATQIGMTATPKETRYISNTNYFGDPVYTYSLKQGIADGFLAPFRVVNITTNISEGWRPVLGQRDKLGNLIEDRVYTNNDFDYNIILQDRIDQVAREITNFMKAKGRMDKTIVFCANEEHADLMRLALVNLNADMVKEYPDYIVRITGSDLYGQSKLKYFISVSEPYPVIATTSKLLSTGVDCKMVKVIVLDQMIGSMTEFKQIIGRGTRLREKDGKTHFTVLDFRNVTRLFADPTWDGPIEIIKPEGEPGGEDGKDPIAPPPPPPPLPSPSPKPIVDRNGCKVEIIGKMVSVFRPDGKLLKQESIIDYTKSNILGEYVTLDNFINVWTTAEKKTAIRHMLEERGIDLDMLKTERDMSDVDDFDFICHIAYGQKPLTRKERADHVKKRDFFGKFSGVARQVLEELLRKYMDFGIGEIENAKILAAEPFSKFGSPSKIVNLFGGKTAYFAAVAALRRELYKAA